MDAGNGWLAGCGGKQPAAERRHPLNGGRRALTVASRLRVDSGADDDAADDAIANGQLNEGLPAASLSVSIWIRRRATVSPPKQRLEEAANSPGLFVCLFVRSANLCEASASRGGAGGNWKPRRHHWKLACPALEETADRPAHLGLARLGLAWLGLTPVIYSLALLFASHNCLLVRPSMSIPQQQRRLVFL